MAKKSSGAEANKRVIENTEISTVNLNYLLLITFTLWKDVSIFWKVFVGSCACSKNWTKQMLIS